MTAHKVTQADREAAAKHYHAYVANKILAGKLDDNPLVQAFAAHRIAHEPKWLPIEDAPRSPVLVACPAKGGEARKTAAAFLDATGVWRVHRSKGGMEPVPFMPTHFQPLPTLPEEPASAP